MLSENYFFYTTRIRLFIAKDGRDNNNYGDFNVDGDYYNDEFNSDA